MSDYENKGYELDWDSEIENEGSEFIVAEPGDYDFVVTAFERGRFQGDRLAVQGQDGHQPVRGRLQRALVQRLLPVRKGVPLRRHYL